MIGQTLGHFRILEKLGAGGMGEVYRAHDERLERDVALKVLPPGLLGDEDSRKRFRKEALALSKLNHSNIATVFDFDSQDGVDFLAMEIVEGETLAKKASGGALSEKEVVSLGTQIAEALEEAHEHNIVHRDLKPGNVMVTAKGRVKVLDFGLAKFLHPEGASGVAATAGSAATESVALTGGVVGTPAYMAPEQLRGEPVDARTDIYALGCVLYEMATGQPVYREEQQTRLIEAILHRPPVSPRARNERVSPELERLILKCLDKQPERRYQSAKEAGVDLHRLAEPPPVSAPPQAAEVAAKALKKWRAPVAAGIAILGLVLLAALAIGLNVGGLRDRLAGRGAAQQIRSLAVLPLENFSHDPEQEYFADGMTEELITDLAKIGALRVISRTSVMNYKGAHKPLPEIARELNVDAVVEGSVQRSGDRVRITAQLIEARTDRHLWAESYERDLRDVLALQGEVARAIAGEVRVKLTPQEKTRLAAARPVDPQAHQLYLEGRFYWEKKTPDGLNRSLGYFQQALGQDPHYAPAYAGIADYYSVLPFYTNARPNEVSEKAIKAAVKAVELDDGLAEAHASLGYVKAYYEWDWSAAEKEFKRALELNPNYATVHHWYSRFLSAQGRLDEARAEIERAQDLDPLSLVIQANQGVISYFGRQYDRAIEQLEKTLQRDPNFSVTHWGLGLAYEQKRMYAQAITELQRALALSGGSTNMLASLGHAYAVAGRRSAGLRILRELKDRSRNHYVSSYQSALVHAGLGEKDAAFASLEAAYQEGSTLLTYLKMDPRWDILRSDPRFADLLRRLGLPPAK